jgi:hypothetical protein
MEVRDDGVHNACSTPGYFLKPAFLSGTVPCNATYLPTYMEGKIIIAHRFTITTFLVDIAGDVAPNDIINLP